MRFRFLAALLLAVLGSGCTYTVITEHSGQSMTNATDFIDLAPDGSEDTICKDVPFHDPKGREDGLDRLWYGLHYPTEMLFGITGKRAVGNRPKADPYELIEDAATQRDRELRNRASHREFLDLCALLGREFRQTKRLAVLELRHCQYAFMSYGFVVLAETSSGYVAAGNMPRWNEYPGTPGRVRLWRVDQERAREWFDRVDQGLLASARIFTRHNAGTIYTAGGSLFVATVGKSNDGSHATHRRWNVEFNDPVLQEMIRGNEPPGPAATDKEACQILREAPSRRPDKNRIRLFADEEDKPQRFPTPEQYDRVRNRYAAAIVPLWEVTQGLPNLKEAGGFEGAVAHLRPLERIGGYEVAADDREGDFYRLSGAFCREGTLEQFRSLVADPNPTVRAMGLLCIARTAPPEVAREVLRQHLSSRTKLHVVVYDHDMDFNEGRLAWALLRNVNFLHADLPARPAVPRAEQMAIDLEILAADNLPHVRLNAASALDFRLATRELGLSLQALEQMCPRLSRLQIIKAVGRIWPEPGTPRAEAAREFLISCLNDGALDTDCRLAACSALARDPSDAAERAVESQKDWLMKCADRDLYARFREDLAAARLYEAALRADVEWGAFTSQHVGFRFGSAKDIKADVVAEQERLASAFTQAEQKLFECRHPLNPYELEQHLRGHDDLGWDSGERPADDASVQWACAVSARLGEYAKPWDTFAYLAADLDQQLDDDAERAKDKAELLADGIKPDWFTLQEVIGEPQYRALVENVRRAVAAQGGAASNR